MRARLSYSSLLAAADWRLAMARTPTRRQAVAGRGRKHGPPGRGVPPPHNPGRDAPALAEIGRLSCGAAIAKPGEQTKIMSLLRLDRNLFKLMAVRGRNLTGYAICIDTADAALHRPFQSGAKGRREHAYSAASDARAEIPMPITP
jgi:hypothetical protein